MEGRLRKDGALAVGQARLSGCLSARAQEDAGPGPPL